MSQPTKNHAGRYVVLVALIAAALAACGRPEAARTRGGGPGADPGNRDQVVELHKGATPFYHTPDEKNKQPVQGASR